MRFLVILISFFFSTQVGHAQTDSATVTKLYDFIQEWWRTDYQYGGTNKEGIDCSAFTRTLYSKVYTKDLPRTAQQQYSITKRIKKEDLQAGDLVFFRYKATKKISGWHVGVYITSGFFVHSGSDRGVFINNLEEPKYQKIYYSAGRF